MDQFNNITCKPVVVYSVIALIILCIKTIIRLIYRPFNFIAFCTQFGSIILCALVLMGVCNISCNMAWILVIVLIMGTLMESFVAVKKWSSTNNNNKTT